MKKQFKQIIYGIFQQIKWNIESLSLAGESTNLLPELSGKIMVLVPHADDELISCWKTLKTYRNNSYVYYCGMTGSNNSVVNKDIRDKEIRTFTDDHGLIIITPNDWKRSLVQTIHDLNIDTVFLPSYIDWHNEHRLVNEILLESLSTLNRRISLYWYSITVPIQTRNSVLMPLTKEELDSKYADFNKYYVSQNHMPVERLKLQERINSKRTKYYSSEVFLEISPQDIQNSIDILEIADLAELKNFINDIKAIRIKSSNLYQKVFGE